MCVLAFGTQFDRTAPPVLLEPGVRQARVHELARRDAEEARDRGVRVDPIARTELAGLASADAGRQAHGLAHVGHERVASAGMMRAAGVDTQRAAPLRSTLDSERGCAREKLHAPPQRIASVLRARRTAQDLDRLEPFRLDEIEEGVHAAALRAVRIAHAVDEDVDLVAGQPADEDARHRRARPLKMDACLPFEGLRDDGLDAGGDLALVDDVDRLAGQADVLDGPARRRDRDFFAKAGRMDDDRKRRRSLGPHRQRVMRLAEGFRPHDQKVGARRRHRQAELSLGVGLRPRDARQLRRLQADFRGAHRRARAVAHDAGDVDRRGERRRRQGHHETRHEHAEYTHMHVFHPSSPPLLLPGVVHTGFHLVLLGSTGFRGVLFYRVRRVPGSQGSGFYRLRFLWNSTTLRLCSSSEEAKACEPSLRLTK